MPLSKRTMTVIGVGLGPVTVALLDVIFVGPETSNELVSAFRDSEAMPFLAWTVALFVGHWFHPVDNLKPFFGLLSSPWNYVVFGLLTVLVAVLSFFVIDTAAVSDWLPFVMALLGFAVGSIFWPV